MSWIMAQRAGPAEMPDANDRPRFDPLRLAPAYTRQGRPQDSRLLPEQVAASAVKRDEGVAGKPQPIRRRRAIGAPLFFSIAVPRTMNSPSVQHLILRHRSVRPLP